MKRLSLAVLLLSIVGFAQNLTTITATKIQRSGVNIPKGTLCFQATDANSSPIAFRLGGGGQEVKWPYCWPIVNGGLGPGTFQVANPANTSPVNIQYTVTVLGDKDQPLATYKNVQFSGTPFDFDAYSPGGTLPIGPFLTQSGSGAFSTNLFTPSSTGLYLLSVAFYVNNCAGNCVMTAQIGCTDPFSNLFYQANAGWSGNTQQSGLAVPAICLSGSPIIARVLISQGTGNWTAFWAATKLGG